MLSSHHWRFFLSWLRAPRHVASAVPSGQALSRLISSRVPVGTDELIIELGGGTGAITQSLLAAGVNPGQLVVLEQHEYFANHLKTRFPNITVLNADAQHLRAALAIAGHENKVCAVVSSLPLLTLPSSMRDRILDEIAELIQPSGCFLQFTYGFRSPVPKNWLQETKRGLEESHVGVAWTNLPPAAVWQYKYPSALLHT